MNNQNLNDPATANENLNPDPITGAHGSHPVGTGVGAASGAAIGAGIGMLGGPIGMAVAGAVGAVVGGLTGKGFAEGYDPTVEETHWRTNYSKEPYADSASSYEEYGPAYRYGWENHSHDTTFNDQEQKLAAGWHNARGASRLEWEKAKHAVRASWDRVGAQRRNQD